jgi:hypothetical protein
MDNPNDDQAFDPELAKYLDRDYWERKKQEEVYYICDQK